MNQLIHFSTPEEAEQAFYSALSSGDADALMAIWAEDEEVVCVHPTGIQLVGANPIRESWRSIFAAAKLRVQPEGVAHWHGMLLSIHHLVETLFVGDDPAPHGPLHVTHVYSRGAQGWRLVSRHASAAGDKPAATEAIPRTLH
jgi:ketosteroid isomerase-like protein